MLLNKGLLTVGALAIALGTTGLSADAAQRRGSEGGKGHARARDRQGSDDSHDSGRRADTPQANGTRGDTRQESSRRDDDRNRGAGQPAQRNDQRSSPQAAPQQRNDNQRRGDSQWRGNYRRPAPRHYYGSGGHLSVYFGLGSGYRYGSPYSGRVYGYVGRPGYGARRYYGDVRLQVRPRDAAVYVDGYYAGIVDNFDGVFQRLTLEVGPHQIEIEAPGLESQLFDVYVDPNRTVDLRGDLPRDGRY